MKHAHKSRALPSRWHLGAAMVICASATFFAGLLAHGEDLPPETRKAAKEDPAPPKAVADLTLRYVATGSDVVEPVEDDIGGVVRINQDNDQNRDINGDGAIDAGDQDSGSLDVQWADDPDDTIALNIHIANVPASYKMRLSVTENGNASSNCIRVFDCYNIASLGPSTRKNPIDGESTMTETIVVLGFGVQGDDALFHVEGVEGGVSMITLEILDAEGQPVRGLTDTVRVTVPRVDLEIANGQGGAFIADDDEWTPGAYTVANLNDTDGDGTVDNAADELAIPDEDGKLGIPNEEDLMELTIHKPDPCFLWFPNVSLALSPKLKLWKSSTKAAGEETARSFGVGVLPKTFWVEVTDKSGSLRDQVVTLTYGGTTDAARITGVWAERTGFKNKDTDTLATDPAWGDAGDPLADLFDDPLPYGGTFGLKYNTDNGPITYKMGMEFKVFPPGIRREENTVVRIDISRQCEVACWTIDGQDVVRTVTEFWPGRDAYTLDGPSAAERDKANDDAGQLDEDCLPDNNHVYSIDGPGHFANNGAHDALVYHGNFLEFVRVSFSGDEGDLLGGNDALGSRCSDKTLWYMWLWSEKVPGQDAYRLLDGKGSALEVDKHKAVLPAPTP